MTVAIYAALLTALFVILSVRTLRLRHRFQVGIGTGEHPEILRAMRVHANFAEYAPLALVLAMLLELSGGHVYLVHGVCAALLVGRVVHAYGVSQVKENFNYRIVGMALTFTSLCTSALALLYLSWVQS